MKNTEAFYDFVVAREQVRLNRAAGLPRDEWTSDPILSMYKFCNIDREHDAGTIFNREHIRPFYNSPQYIAIARLARTINRPETLKAMLDDGVITDSGLNPEDVRDWVTKYKAQGGKVWRPAYQSGKPAVKGQTFPDWYEIVVRDANRMTPDLMTAIELGENEGILAAFERLPTTGSFLANQIIMDIAHTPLMDHTDYKDNFTSLGPGSKRGLEKVYGSADRYMDKFAELRAGLPEELSGLSLHNIQNCLCEYDKYVRRTETPTNQNKYKG
jgi:hypothetical protein